MNIFVGIDYSMSSPAACLYKEGATYLFNLNGRKTMQMKTSINNSFHLTVSLLPELSKNEIERYAALSKCFLDFILMHSNDEDDVYVMIEGYSFGSTGSRVLNIAENCQTLKLRLYNEKRIRLLLPSPAPTTIKKFATGKGTAKKAEMHTAFQKITNIELLNTIDKGNIEKSPIADLVDAYWICEYCKENYAKNDKTVL